MAKSESEGHNRKRASNWIITHSLTFLLKGTFWLKLEEPRDPAAVLIQVYRSLNYFGFPLNRLADTDFAFFDI